MSNEYIMKSMVNMSINGSLLRYSPPIKVGQYTPADFTNVHKGTQGIQTLAVGKIQSLIKASPSIRAAGKPKWAAEVLIIDVLCVKINFPLMNGRKAV